MHDNTPEIIQPENLIILEDTHADAHTEDVVLDENTIILAAGDTYSLIDMKALRSAVKKSGLSYEDIAEQKDISVSSIYKFFAQKSKSPSFYNTLMIFKAVGASVDEICGLRPSSPSQDSDLLKRIDRLTDSVHDLQKIVAAQSKLIESLLRDLHTFDDY